MRDYIWYQTRGVSPEVDTRYRPEYRRVLFLITTVEMYRQGRNITGIESHITPHGGYKVSSILNISDSGRETAKASPS